MKTRLLLVTVSLIATMVFGSCTKQPPTPPDGLDTGTGTNTTEQVSEAPADPYEAVRESDEVWLSYGLAAYEAQNEPQDLKDFFSTQSNLSYLTLYDHMFTYDKEKSVPVAEALFKFICDEYGIDALLDTEKRCEYKTAYLRSIGSDLEYVQQSEIEGFLSSMDFSADDAEASEFPYIFTIDNIHYHFENFNDDSISAYHSFLYYNTTALRSMVQFLEGKDIHGRLDADREFHFYMTMEGGMSHTTYADGKMYINDGGAALHEAVHAMGIHLKNHIWLSEGICGYLGDFLGFDPRTATSRIQTMNMVGQGYLDEQIASGNQSAILFKAIYDEYIARGGSLESPEAFDSKLFLEVNVKVEIDAGGVLTTLGQAWADLNHTACTAVGAELSYGQAASLVSYLADTYGLDRVLEAYHTDDVVSALGKDYESLKSEWLEYLYRS